MFDPAPAYGDVVEWSTAAHAVGAQPADLWRVFIREVFFELDTTPRRPAEFEGLVRLKDCSAAAMGVQDERRRFALIQAGGQRVERTRRQAAQSAGDRMIALFQVSGASVARQAGREAVLSEGDFCFVDSARPYELDFEDSFGQFCLDFPARVLLDAFSPAHDLTAMRLSRPDGVARLVFRLVATLFEDETARPETRAALFDKAVQLLGVLAADEFVASGRSALSTARAHRLAAAEAFIERRLKDRTLSVGAIAAALKVSDRYLREIYAEAGMSLQHSIAAKRLERARRDLLAPHSERVSVSEIAYRWGFCSPSHFAKAFKAQFGRSPSEEREAERAARHVGSAAPAALPSMRNTSSPAAS